MSAHFPSEVPQSFNIRASENQLWHNASYNIVNAKHYILLIKY